MILEKYSSRSCGRKNLGGVEYLPVWVVKPRHHRHNERSPERSNHLTYVFVLPPDLIFCRHLPCMPVPYIKYIVVIEQKPHDRQLPAMGPPFLYEKDTCICFLILTFIAFRVSKVIPNILFMRTSGIPSITLCRINIRSLHDNFSRNRHRSILNIACSSTGSTPLLDRAAAKMPSSKSNWSYRMTFRFLRL